jgi:hypothetical protein
MTISMLANSQSEMEKCVVILMFKEFKENIYAMVSNMF